jgi:hypothetical protein
LAATSFFGDARKYEYNYYGLTSKDLKEISFWGYFRVAVFLLGILLFWVFCGWLAKYSLPFDEVLAILAGCFSNGMPEKFVRFQEMTLREDVPNASNPTTAKSYSRTHVLLGILSRLSPKSPGVKIKAGNTAAKIKRKQGEIERLVSQRPHTNFWRFCYAQRAFMKLFESGLSRDYDQLSLVIRDIENISFQVQDMSIDKAYALENIKQTIRQAKLTFDPARFNVLSELENSVEIFLSLYSFESSQGDPEVRLRETIQQRNSLSAYVERLQLQIQQKASELSAKKRSLDGLESEIRLLKRSLKNAESEIRNLDKDKDEALDRLGEEKQTIRLLNEERNRLMLKIKNLEKLIENQKKESKELNNRLNNLVEKSFSGISPGKKIRSLEGRFIGNAANPGTKFHFDFDCPHYWSYVGQYLYSSDPKTKSIITCENSSRLESAGLEPCIICCRKRNL